jgi:antitoxin component of MazEF toxin-antitoxin module
MITQRVRKNGSSLAVTIPKEEVERLGLHEGDLVAIQINKVRVRVELPADVRAAAEESLRERAADYAYLADN